jgi:hypothetical protein
MEAVEPSNHAQTVAGFIREHGASFFDELVEGTGLLRTQTEDALAECARMWGKIPPRWDLRELAASLVRRWKSELQ